MILTAPVRHVPSCALEAEEIRESHHFTGEPGDERCVECDSRPGSASASWPCGSPVPRETVERRDGWTISTSPPEPGDVF